MLQYNDMTVFAIFKYSPDKPALRVHIWDIFENANLETVDFNQFFDSVYDQLLEVYEDNGFDEEGIKELSDLDLYSDNDVGGGSIQADSANEDFADAVGAITKYNLFDSQYLDE